MLSSLSFYVCPGPHRDQSLNPTCEGSYHFYCKNWGYETTGDTYRKPSSSWDYISVEANYSHSDFSKWKELSKGVCQGWCHHLQINFTESGKKATGSLSGYYWGLRLYKERIDDGIIFKIRQRIESLMSQPIGPNQVLTEQGPPTRDPPQTQEGSNNKIKTPNPSPGANKTSLTLSSTGQRLLNFLQGHSSC